MPHSQSFTAIVLKTYDVGEADRLCILFTREKGRIMARASGARRMTSRLGHSLLPFRTLTVELKEGKAGWIVAGVHTEGVQRVQGFQGPDLEEFTRLEEGIEMLLRLVPHEGELPDVFDATTTFIDACAAGEDGAVLGYSFRLLHLLGLLPGEEEMSELERAGLGEAEIRYISACREGRITGSAEHCDLRRLQTLRTLILAPQLNSPLRAPDVVEAML